MGGAEPLAGANHRRQDLLRVLCAVDPLHRVHAHVAVAAGLDALSEVLQERHPPAGRRLAVAQQRVEPLVLPQPALRARVLLFDELAAHADVRQAVEHVRFRGLAVAPGAADLLVVRLDAAGQIGVQHVAHVRLVDAHAEGDGGHHHHSHIGHESVLVRLPVLLVHACVVWKRAHAVRRQHGGGLLRLPARQAVHDAALALVARQKVPGLAFPLLFQLHRQPDVGAVEAQDERLHLAAEQALGDVLASDGVGGGGQRRDGNAREKVPEPAQVFVFGAERRTPLRDAMSLVHGEQLDGKPAQGLQHTLGHEPLRCHVQQPRLARGGPAPCGDVGGPGIGRVDGVRRHSGEAQRRHLVLHQRHERRHDHGQAAQGQRRDLKTQRLARARGHHGEHMTPRQQRLDGALLAGTEAVKAESLPEYPLRGAHRFSPGSL